MLTTFAASALKLTALVVVLAACPLVVLAAAVAVLAGRDLARHGLMALGHATGRAAARRLVAKAR